MRGKNNTRPAQNRRFQLQNRLQPLQNGIVPNYSSKIASHPESKAIIARILAGDQLKLIARDFGLSSPTLSKFRQKILRPAALGSYLSTRSQVNSDSLNAVQHINKNVNALVVQESTADLVAKKLGRYDRILQAAEKAGELGNWASIDRAETAALQLQAQLRGEVNQVHTQTTVQMVVYTPNVEQDEEVTEVLEVEAVRAIEEIEAPEPPPPADPVAEVLARLPRPKPKKPPKPPSLFKRLQGLSAKDRKNAIRLIGQGLDPFAAAPDLPDLPE